MFHLRILFFTLLLSFVTDNIEAAQVTQSFTQIMNDRLINSPFFWGIEGQNDATVALLTGVDVNVRDKDDNTVLMNAVKSERPDIIQLLIDARTDLDVNLANCKGETPLAVALSIAFEQANFNTSPNNLDIIELLIASGATLDIDTYMYAHGFQPLLRPPILDAIKRGRAQYNEHKETHDAYEKQVTNNVHQCLQKDLIPDLVNIVNEYSKMTFLEFRGLQVTANKKLLQGE